MELSLNFYLLDGRGQTDHSHYEHCEHCGHYDHSGIYEHTYK